MAIYESYSEYYPSIYQNKDYLAETKALVAALVRIGLPEQSRILDVGSGTGRHVEAMQLLGFPSEGVEPSASMAEIALSRGVTTYVSQIENLRLDQLYDVCTALFAVVNYIHPSELRTFFSALRSNLREGGLAALEIWGPDSPEPVDASRDFQHKGREYIRSVAAEPEALTAWSLMISIIERESRRVVARERHRIYRHSLEVLQSAGQESGLKILSRQPVLLNPSRNFHETYLFRVEL